MAKTRFKTWWGLIGWPVEYAAGLLGINVDCTELLRAGEAQDEDANAASRVLTLLRKRWGDKAFKAQAVVAALSAANSLVDESAEQAHELAAALGELAGEAFEKPTARKIGKLFQKHLTNRPACIDGGNCVAVLRNKSNDRANEYKVEILQQPTAEGDQGEPENVSAESAEQPWSATL